MALRCLLFSSDEGTAQPIGQMLTELGIEVEHCAQAVQAVARVTSQAFQLVIVDWDDQPEAAFLLNTSRERKASERPMALAMVGNDANVPQALQAGANSILRKPIQVNQAKDTLTTARGLLRAKYEPAPPAAMAASASASGNSAVGTPNLPPRDTASESTLRAGEFLQSGETPSTHFVTESEVPIVLDQVVASEVDPLKELEPMAASVSTSDAVTEPPRRELDEPRGLSWYLKARPIPVAEPVPAKAELLSFSETSPQSEAPASAVAAEAPAPTPSEHEQRTEAALFAYITGDAPEENEPKPRRKFSKVVVVGVAAAVLVVAYLVFPQSVWRPRVQSLIVRAARAGHSWLNPQPVTTPQAPVSHENFGRAGDEYKLPVAENIPDATTDPSQIRVVPVVDPTVKQPTGANATGQTATPIDTAPKDVPDPSQSSPVPTQENQNPDSQPPQTGTSQAPGGQTAVQTPPQQQPQVVATPIHVDAPAPSVTAPPESTPPAPKAHYAPPTTSPAIPSSLKSQMASTTAEAGGNKPADAALPSIEPVDLPEATARALLVQQPDPAYPDNAKGQHGTIVLQLLIGRDGTVQDAKFMQGSFVFARAAIDAVRQWQFRPYTLNTHPASVRTVITLTFKPTS